MARLVGVGRNAVNPGATQCGVVEVERKAPAARACATGRGARAVPALVTVPAMGNTGYVGACVGSR